MLCFALIGDKNSKEKEVQFGDVTFENILDTDFCSPEKPASCARARDPRHKHVPSLSYRAESQPERDRVALAKAKQLALGVGATAPTSQNGQSALTVQACAAWVLDSGSANDLMGRKNLPDNVNGIYEDGSGTRLATANGIIKANMRCDVVAENMEIKPLALVDYPNALSMGKMIEERGFHME